MKDEISEWVNLLLKHRLTANQFIFLYLKVRHKDEALYRYLETTRALSAKELNELEERGLIINANVSANDYWADHYIVADGFAKIIDPFLQMAEEFWSLYPSMPLDGRRKTLLKSVDKIEFLFAYAFTVMLDNQIHASAMRALRYLIGKKEVNQRIDVWVEEKRWRTTEKEISSIREAAFQSKQFKDGQI